MMEQKNNMLPIGTLLRGGTYRVTRQLKSGGFGNTYVVENIHFGETYAMKEFFMQGVTSRNGTTVSISIEDNAEVFNEQKEKFKKEAQRIRKLNHPNIVKIHDLFEDNGTCYYVMDFIDGESLADQLDRKGPMNENEALSVLNSLLDALSVVHAAGFTHMDIKPGNIMQDRQGKVYLIDFGASKQMTSNEQRTLATSTAMPYSEGYAPIEQVERKIENIGPWTDFYAVGATMYRLLTNNTPPLSSEIIDNVVNNGQSPFMFSNNISNSTQLLIKWMMQPGRNNRPQTVSEIIKRVQTGEKKTAFGNPLDLSAKHVVETTIYDNPGEVKATVVTSSVNIITNKTNPVIDRILSNMVKVEGGTFMMGDHNRPNSWFKRNFSGDSYCDFEVPVHKVRLSTFYISKYPVRIEEWKSIMGYFPKEHKNDSYEQQNDYERYSQRAACLSWDECNLFISKLIKFAQKKFRMPTEAEWEYAARGGNKSLGYTYPGSDKFIKGDWSDFIYPVTSGAPNELGLYALRRSRGEWCSDWFDFDYYKKSPTDNPKGPSGPVLTEDHVIRGGLESKVYSRSLSRPNQLDVPFHLRLVMSVN